jgi:hypothetical protein
MAASLLKTFLQNYLYTTSGFGCNASNAEKKPMGRGGLNPYSLRAARPVRSESFVSAN